MFTVKTSLSCLLLLIFTTSCVFGVGQEDLAVPTVEAPEFSTAQKLNSSYAVSYLGIQDARTDKTIVFDEEYEWTINTSEDVEQEVSKAFENTLKNKGINLTSRQQKTLSGEIESWSAKLVRNPKPEVNSKAKLKLFVRDSAGNVIYTKAVESKYIISKPLVTKDDIRSCLGEAMQDAFAEAMADEAFLSQLNDRQG